MSGLHHVPWHALPTAIERPTTDRRRAAENLPYLYRNRYGP